MSTIVLTLLDAFESENPNGDYDQFVAWIEKNLGAEAARRIVARIESDPL